MNMQSVSSSRMNKVGWENNTMHVEFKNGQVYVYQNVSKSEYESFLNSSSLGSALSRLDKTHPYHPI